MMPASPNFDQEGTMANLPTKRSPWMTLLTEKRHWTIPLSPMIVTVGGHQDGYRPMWWALMRNWTSMTFETATREYIYDHLCHWCVERTRNGPSAIGLNLCLWSSSAFLLISVKTQGPAYSPTNRANTVHFGKLPQASVGAIGVFL